MKNLKFWKFLVGGSRSQGFRKYLRTADGKLVAKHGILYQHKVSKSDVSTAGEKLKGVVLEEAIARLGGRRESLDEALRNGSVISSKVKGLQVCGSLVVLFGVAEFSKPGVNIL